MSNPWAQSFDELRSPYLQEKKAKKDYDGDGKIESGAKEYRGVVHNKIQKAKGGKADGQDTSSVKEHHQKDANGNPVEHGDGTPSNVDEAKIDTVDPKNKRKRRNERAFGKQTKPYDPDTKEMKTSMGKFMNSMRHKMHQSKRGRKTTGPDAGMKKEEIVLEADKKGKGSGSKDACYHKVKSRYSVWPSAYASGALVKCRKVGAKNWGKKSKKEEFDYYQMPMKSFGDMVGECWKTHRQEGYKKKGDRMVPNCVPKNEEFVGEEGINKDPAFDIMRPGGKNSPYNKDGTPKVNPNNFKLPGEKGRIEYLKTLNMGEAVKSPKLDIKETGVKNKIEINPEIKTEAAKAPVKK